MWQKRHLIAEKVFFFQKKPPLSVVRDKMIRFVHDGMQMRLAEDWYVCKGLVSVAPEVTSSGLLKRSD